MNKIIRDIDEQLWKEVKAQAKLECIPLVTWIEEALRTTLGSETTRRKRLPNKAICRLCHQDIYKKPEAGQRKLIVHHDQANNRNPSVVMLVCEKCHRERHARLGWGNGAGNTFKCIICKKRYPRRQLGHEHTKYKSYPLDDNRWKTNVRKFKICRACWQKGISFNSNDIPIALSS